LPEEWREFCAEAGRPKTIYTWLITARRELAKQIQENAQELLPRRPRANHRDHRSRHSARVMPKSTETFLFLIGFPFFFFSSLQASAGSRSVILPSFAYSCSLTNRCGSLLGRTRTIW
jgi:hypothetical protein